MQPFPCRDLQNVHLGISCRRPSQKSAGTGELVDLGAPSLGHNCEILTYEAVKGRLNGKKAYIRWMTFVANKGHKGGTAEGISAVDKLVLATVNAPFKRDISAATLQECIAQAEISKWPVHVATFFTDVSPRLVLSFAAGHGISKSKLAEAYVVMKTTTGERNPDLESELVPLATFTR